MIDIQNAQYIECPCCKKQDDPPYYMGHPVAVYVICGDERTTITSDGVTEDMGGWGSARGVIIAIEYVCESGHRWRTTQQFHKGSTFTETTILPYNSDIKPHAMRVRPYK